MYVYYSTLSLGTRAQESLPLTSIKIEVKYEPFLCFEYVLVLGVLGSLALGSAGQALERVLSDTRLLMTLAPHYPVIPVVHYLLRIRKYLGA